MEDTDRQRQTEGHADNQTGWGKVERDGQMVSTAVSMFHSSVVSPCLSIHFCPLAVYTDKSHCCCQKDGSARDQKKPSSPVLRNRLSSFCLASYFPAQFFNWHLLRLTESAGLLRFGGRQSCAPPESNSFPLVN